MPIEKINCFLNCFFDSLEISDEEFKTYIRNGIIDRYNKYISSFPIIQADNNTDKNFIIKSNNGYYSLEDFLLNRLFQSIRYVCIDDISSQNFSEFSWRNRSVDVSIDNIRKAIINNKNVPQESLERFFNTFIGICFDHELGHALKTKLYGGYQAIIPPALNSMAMMIASSDKCNEQTKKVLPKVLESLSPDFLYKKLINNLANMADGKYSSMIISPNELVEGESKLYSIGINNKKYEYLYLIDEILQQEESMSFFPEEEHLPLKKTIGENGSYINTFDVGYYFILGYGKILKSLLGFEGTFQSTYLDPNPILYKFNKDYEDLSRKFFLNNLAPIYNVCDLLYGITMTRKEEYYLQLDHFLVSCYRQMIEEKLNSETSINIDEILKEIDSIQERLTTNDCEEIRDKMPHHIILNDLKTTLLQLKESNGKKI